MRLFFVTLQALCLAGPVLAQAPTTGAPQKAPQHQPGVAEPSHTPNPDAKSAPSHSADKIDPEKEAAVRHLMDITETSKLGDNIATYLKGQVHDGVGRAIGPDKVDAFMGTFSRKFSATSPATAVTDAMVPIYAKAFSMEDIQGLIQFYESPLGQRVVKALPDVVQQSQMAGVQIEQASALKVLREMTDEYPELKQVLPPENEQPAPPAAPAPAPGQAPKPPPSAPPK
ncbi:MAG TPA: DUF2059 domain-containing protein [Candidatus Acidoferrales bacterium]|nr:DUF2059 domain-containing protein [Candidatus Acidoferrales bacterium]